MINFAPTSRVLVPVLVTILLIAPGCSSSPSESTSKIGGMTPGEYREKAELSREIPAKAKGRVR